MTDIADLPMLHDIDADYTPQYVKLARILRGKIKSGEYHHGDMLPAPDLAHEYKVSIQVTCSALAMLAANRYVSRPGTFTSYAVTWQAGHVMSGRRRRVDEIPKEQSAVVGVNIRTLRQRKGWTQTELGKLMGWPTTATVCAAEGHRGGRQRGFTAEEVQRLADLFDVPTRQLTTQCVNCGGHPPTGFACLACGASL